MVCCDQKSWAQSTLSGMQYINQISACKNKDWQCERRPTNEGSDRLNTKPSRGSQSRTWPEELRKLTVGDAAGWANMVPSPGWKGKRSGPEDFIPSDSRPSKYLGSQFKFHRGKGRQQTCFPAPQTQPLGPRSWLPAPISEEVTVCGAHTEESGQKSSTAEPWPSARRALRPQRSERAASVALSAPAPALPRPRPGRGEKFPTKVCGTRSRSQPPDTTA